jgi:hypothetical protein
MSRPHVLLLWPHSNPEALTIIAATSHMRTQFTAHRDKLFFCPGEWLARSMCVADSCSARRKLELVFVGGLVRRKAQSNSEGVCIPGDSHAWNREPKLVRRPIWV